MMTCDSDDLEALVFGGLSPETAARVRTHLASCAQCREEHAALLHERGLFAARRRLGAEGRDALPDVDAILRAANQPQGLFARLTARSADGTGARLAPRAWTTAMERVAAVAAVAVVGIVVARQHPTRAPDSDRPTARAPMSASARSPDGAAFASNAVCAPQEAVCRATLPLSPRSSVAMTPSMGTDRQAMNASEDAASEEGGPFGRGASSPSLHETQDCGRSSSSSMPSAFDRVVSGSTMCIPNEI